MSDLISREALIEEIKQRAGMWQKTAEKFISVIKEQQTVEAVPVVHGEWIAQNEGLTRFKCSVCNGKNHGGHEKFCPDCGADMRKKV